MAGGWESSGSGSHPPAAPGIPGCPVRWLHIPLPTEDDPTGTCDTPRLRQPDPAHPHTARPGIPYPWVAPPQASRSPRPCGQLGRPAGELQPAASLKSCCINHTGIAHPRSSAHTSNFGVRPAAHSCPALANCLSAGVSESAAPSGTSPACLTTVPSHAHISTFGQPCTSALPLQTVFRLLGIWASAAPYGTSPTCLNPVPSHAHISTLQPTRGGPLEPSLPPSLPSRGCRSPYPPPPLCPTHVLHTTCTPQCAVFANPSASATSPGSACSPLGARPLIAPS